MAKNLSFLIKELKSGKTLYGREGTRLVYDKGSDKIFLYVTADADNMVEEKITLKNEFIEKTIETYIE